MTPRQVVILNGTLRRKLKKIDSYYLSQAINIEPEIILRWKDGKYDLSARDLNLLTEKFS